MLALNKTFAGVNAKPVSFLIASQKTRSLLCPSILCLGLSLFCITANSEDWVLVYE